MTLQDASIQSVQIANIPFGTLFSEEELRYAILDKGKIGKVLERALGLRNGPSNKDFIDGELKTNKCKANGEPMETIAITQISSHIEELIANKPFKDTWLYEKISNILYVPVCREGMIKDWFFFPSLHIDLTNPRFTKILNQLEEDYNLICTAIRKYCEEGKVLSTINGKYIQIRTKDSCPYHPIYSTSYGRNISDKNRAFYFKKEFILAIREVI